MALANSINNAYLTSYYVLNNIDLKTTGALTLFTTPADKSFVVMFSVLEAVNFDTATVAGVFNVGTNAATYDNIDNGQTTSLLASGTSLLYTIGGNSPIVVPAGTTVKVNITTGVTATTATGNFYLVGILK